MIDWILNLVPWWAWLITAIVAVAVAWRLLGWQGAAAAATAFVAALSYGKGRNEAYRDERAKADRRNLKAAKTRKDIDNEVDQLGNIDLDERLRRWMRDDDAR